MKLDCIRQKDGTWAIINEHNGGIVATSDLGCGYAWMAAAHNLADAIDDMQRTIICLSPQRFNEETP